MIVIIVIIAIEIAHKVVRKVHRSAVGYKDQSPVRKLQFFCQKNLQTCDRIVTWALRYFNLFSSFSKVGNFCLHILYFFDGNVSDRKKYSDREGQIRVRHLLKCPIPNYFYKICK